MTRIKATVRRMQVPNLVHLPGHRIGQKNIMNRRLRNAPYKIKKLLPEYKRVDIKKNGQIVRSVNVKKNYLLYRKKKDGF